MKRLLMIRRRTSSRSQGDEPGPVVLDKLSHFGGFFLFKISLKYFELSFLARRRFPNR